MASMLYQKWFLKTWLLVKTLKNFVWFGSYDFVKINLARGTNMFKRKYAYFKLPMSALATVTRKRFHGKFTMFTAKINFPVRHFMLPLLMLTSEVLGLPIHYFISIWVTCWWNLNKVEWSKLYKILSFLTKIVNFFLIKCWCLSGRGFCDWNNRLMLNY